MIMRVPRYRTVLEKSIRAMVSAIEVYNKPDFKYREETFAVLSLNSWELLLKAKILFDNNNKLNAIYKYETRKTKSGERSKKKYIVRNKAGNPQTIGFWQAFVYLEEIDSVLDSLVKSNLEALAEVRNNAVHFVNNASLLQRRVFELSAANVLNYISLVRLWFDETLDSYNLHLLPLGFLQNRENIAAAVISKKEENVIAFLETTAARSTAKDSEFCVMLDVAVKMTKRDSLNTVDLARSKDEHSTKVLLTEEDIRDKYPWDYRQLSDRLKSRYTDFKENAKYHEIRANLQDDQRYAHIRLLDMENPSSGKKTYFSSNIMNEFDKHYTRS